MAPSTSPSTPVRLFFNFCTLYFVLIEPIFALGGTYLCLFDPLSFVSRTLASYRSHLSVTETAVVAQLGSSYALFAIIGGLVLRSTKDRAVWRTVVFGCALSDLGHLYGCSVITGWRYMAMATEWSSDEWINYGTLYFGLALRLLFLALS